MHRHRPHARAPVRDETPVRRNGEHALRPLITTIILIFQLMIFEASVPQKDVLSPAFSPAV